MVSMMNYLYVQLIGIKGIEMLMASDLYIGSHVGRVDGFYDGLCLGAIHG